MVCGLGAVGEGKDAGAMGGWGDIPMGDYRWLAAWGVCGGVCCLVGIGDDESCALGWVEGSLMVCWGGAVIRKDGDCPEWNRV